ncbi:transglutaminase family protein [Rhizobacter sp. OV335]|uniref:transglutaminase family protein n=1 Tax=Rhizobacter sp. OV335 TaxID=1500264 RepID=UPI0009193C09|nr:transglutaminase family protein [Rhizobacter sp. OV335]SHM63130.1 Transglutaminase-like enzyme, putative cysteine protease [Rhizobacter sp. OV335]
MKLDIRHVTHYDYSAPLQYALQSLCLTPQANAHQTVLDWSLSAPGQLFAQRDAFGNLGHTWSLRQRVYRGVVRAAGVVRTHASPLLVDDRIPPAFYLRATPLTEAADALAALGREHLDGPVDEARALTLALAVADRIAYEGGKTTTRTSAAEALALGAGVCQDQAHVFIAACRAAGVPARYVSGYFHAPDAPALASHAWADICVDPAARRWLSVDITHRCLMDERHVRLAVGPDYAACSPIRGVREGGGDETMRVTVDIGVLDDAPTPDPRPHPETAVLTAQEP